MNRRSLICRTFSVAGIIGLTGCSMASLNAESDNHVLLDRIILRGDTEQVEQLGLTLVYAPPNGATSRLVSGSYEVPASGDVSIINDFEGEAGFYSLTAHSTNHNNVETISFNSNGNAVNRDSYQFEVVVTETGDVWTNLNEAGETISIPGY